MVVEGGWKEERRQRKKAGGGPGSPMESVSKMLDQLKDTLMGLVGEAGLTIEVYVEEATSSYESWMSAEGDAMIAKAKRNKKMSGVEVPVGNFHRAGLLAALKVLKEQLAELGGTLAELADGMKVLGKEKVSDLRRMVDQLVQHFVMDKVQSIIFPDLKARLDDLDLPKGPVAKQIKAKAFQMAEDIVRKEIHKLVLSAFASLTENMTIPGCGVMLEKFDPKTEDAVRPLP